MKCLILAAGYATRLYPLTENFPKPLLKVGDKTILDWLIDDIDTSGKVDEYIVISNHKYYEHFVHWSGSKTQRITIVDDGTSTNETRLGAVKDIQFAIVVPTMSVISPEPRTVMIGSEYTLPGLVTKLVELVSVMAATLSGYQNGLQRKFTAKLRYGLPRSILSKLIWLTMRA